MFKVKSYSTTKWPLDDRNRPFDFPIWGFQPWVPRQFHGLHDLKSRLYDQWYLDFNVLTLTFDLSMTWDVLKMVKTDHMTEVKNGPDQRLNLLQWAIYISKNNFGDLIK